MSETRRSPRFSPPMCEGLLSALGFNDDTDLEVPAVHPTGLALTDIANDKYGA
jgi:hypothetical protein